MSSAPRLFFKLLAASACASLAAAGDTLYFKDGRTQETEIIEVTDHHVVTRNADRRNTTLDRADIVTARFARRPEMDAADSAEGIQRIDNLRRVWYLLRPSLEMPESPAGDWGLAFAESLIDSTVEDNVRLAFEVFETIQSRDWSRSRRHAAHRGRFNTMLNLGQFDEALAEAKRIANQPEGGDPELLILARLMLGDLARRDLAALEDEHPRWIEDDDVRPRRQALFDTALDHYLYPHLYHGDRPADAARGLASVIKLFEDFGPVDAAAPRIQDLILLYPTTPEAGTRKENQPDNDPPPAAAD